MKHKNKRMKTFSTENGGDFFYIKINYCREITFNAQLSICFPINGHSFDVDCNIPEHAQHLSLLKPPTIPHIIIKV